MARRGLFAILSTLVVFVLGAALAHAELVQRGDLRVAFDAQLVPHALPRSKVAPVAVTVGGRIATVDGALPPQLRRISIAINRHGRIFDRGLPSCTLRQIQPASTIEALRACRGALVGRGTFSAKVLLPQQSPFPSEGRVFAFNGTFHARPAILAHVYGTDPVPTSYTIPFVLSPSGGTYGTTLRASLPRVTSEWGYVTGLQITLRRTYTYRDRPRSYLSAACAAPKGIPGVLFPLARASFVFSGGAVLANTLTRSCEVRE